MEHEETNGTLDLSLINPPPPQPIGVYGWRKRCLYAFVLALMVIVIMNLALTVWILRVLDFSFDGMGHLRIVPKGFQLIGEAEFLKPVYVDKLKSNQGKKLFIESSKAIELLTLDKNQGFGSRLVVDEDNITMTCDTLHVLDSKGNTNLLLSKDKVVLGSGDVMFPGEIRLQGSLLTPTVLSPSDSLLQISSESMVNVFGQEGITLTSGQGNLTVDANDIYLSSGNGSIHLNGQNIFLNNIPTVNITTEPTKKPSASTPAVFQLCVCENGRVFLSSSHCSTTKDICMP